MRELAGHTDAASTPGRVEPAETVTPHRTDRRTGPVARLLIWPIRGYQLGISRFTPATCRFYPCCSSYAIAALRTHGAAKGLALAAWRLLRCHPWSAGGIDHVPARGSWRRPTERGPLPDDNGAPRQIVIPDPAQPPLATTSTAGRTAA